MLMQAAAPQATRIAAGMTRLAQTLLASLGALVLVVVSLEASFGGILRLRERRSLETLPGRAADPEMPWAADYWREWRTACRLPDRMRYTGDGVWHLEPFAGRAINIGADGLRRTSNTACGDGALRIAMFGGSMLWGHGVPDDLTIPSLLAARYRRDGRLACVSNHGEWGATTRSALAELLHELQRLGGRPDVVLFYAGSYDAKEALFHAAGESGSEIEATIRAGERRRREPWFFRDSALARLFNPRHRDASRRRLPAVTAEAAGDEAVRVVAEVQRIVEALAPAYGFRPFFVWHPYVLSGEKQLTREEEALVTQVDRDVPDIAVAIRRAYRAAHERRAPGFRDFSDIFATRRETLFIDAGHLTAAGNRIIADRLYDILTSRTETPAGLP